MGEGICKRTPFLAVRFTDEEASDFVLRCTGPQEAIVLASKVGTICSQNGQFFCLTYDRRTKNYMNTGGIGANSYMFANLYKDIEKATIFILNSQRYSIGQCSVAEAAELSQNAANLPAALHS